MRYTCPLCARATETIGRGPLRESRAPRRRKTRARDRDEERDRESTRDDRERPCCLRLEDPGAVSRARARRTRAEDSDGEATRAVPRDGVAARRRRDARADDR